MNKLRRETLWATKSGMTTGEAASPIFSTFTGFRFVIGVPPVIIHFERWDCPWNQPSSYWGTPVTMETIPKSMTSFQVEPRGDLPKFHQTSGSPGSGEEEGTSGVRSWAQGTKEFSWDSYGKCLYDCGIWWMINDYSLNLHRLRDSWGLFLSWIFMRFKYIVWPGLMEFQWSSRGFCDISHIPFVATEASGWAPHIWWFMHINVNVTRGNHIIKIYIHNSNILYNYIQSYIYI